VSKAPPCSQTQKRKKRNIAVGLWTTQERCPQAYSDNNRRKQLIKIDQTNHPLDRAMFYLVSSVGLPGLTEQIPVKCDRWRMTFV
jgi:hypothetical protein